MNTDKLSTHAPAQVSREQTARLASSIQTVLKGKDDVIQLALVALFARGHLLIEDVPGVARPLWHGRWHARSAASFTGFSSLQTFCPRT